MKKIVSILSVVVCITAISVNVMIQTENEFGGFDLKLLNLQAMAQGEIEPLDTWDNTDFYCHPGDPNDKTFGRNCRRVSGGIPDCTPILC